MIDAGERWQHRRCQLDLATTVGELAVARSIVVEGLHATRLVRTNQRLDPGPDPTLPAPAPAASAPGQAIGSRPWDGQQPRHRGGLRALGAGAAGGPLGGLIGGGVLGEMRGGGEDRGSWSDGDGGSWGDDGGGDDGGGDGDW